MADGHRGITEAAIKDWSLTTADTVLDVGCGNGWAVQALIARGAGQGFGVDIAPKMIAAATAATQHDDRFTFRVSPAERTPFEANQMSHILNVESLYYYPDPSAALKEWARICSVGGKLAIVVDLYLENPATHTWIEALAVDVHLLSSADIVGMAREAGWRKVHWEQVHDPRPLTDEASFKTGPYWPSYAMYKAYRETGALVIHATR